MKKKTKEEFIESFNKKFPNKNIDFSNSIYIDTHTPIEAICNKGHHFNIKPCDLLNGYGCSECYGNKKMTKEDFIKASNYVHNNYFTHEHCNFTNVSSDVIVTCPIHGDITVKANNHLNGANCRFCSREGITHKITKRIKKNRNTKKISPKDFEQKAKSKWGNKYIIDENTNFINYKLPVKIKCPIHGYFNIFPNHFLNGEGCSDCARNRKKDENEIIYLIRESQPYADYDFSYVIYNGIHYPIKLKCNKCGTIFENSPSNLIHYKNGCPGCKGSQLEIEITDFLTKNNVTFHREKTFKWLKDKKHMKLDFYLDDYNTAIECQGIQHFKDVCFSNYNSEKSEDVQKRDILKKILCEENGINVYYYANYHYDFPYMVYEDKEKMLSDIKNKNTKII